MLDSPAPKVRWGLANEGLVRGSIDRAMMEQFPDYRSRRYSHWRKLYHKYDWESIPDAVAARISQIPNRYRLKPGCKKKGPASKNYELPPELEGALKDQIDRLVDGEHACMPRAEHVTVADVTHTLEWLCDEINAEVKHQSIEVSDENRQLVQQYQRGTISKEELADSFKNQPKKLVIKDYKHLARKFLKKNKFSKQACNTSGNYLPFDDERMKESPIFQFDFYF